MNDRRFVRIPSNVLSLLPVARLMAEKKPPFSKTKDAPMLSALREAEIDTLRLANFLLRLPSVSNK